MFSAGISKQISGGNVDPQFNYVTALLHGDGTNGAQNNTFVDTSGNSLAITRNGTPTQGTFSPYGSLWSNYFPGSSYLSFANSTAFSGDFTVELWVFPTTFATDQALVKPATSNSFDGLQINSSTGYVACHKDGVGADLTSTTALTLNQWNHILWTRASNVERLWLNGTYQNQRTQSSAYIVFTQIGRMYYDNGLGTVIQQIFGPGYISNVRLLTSALYSTNSNITVPTTSLTTTSQGATNCILLTCQSNRFTDNSTSVFTITLTGTPSVQRFNPFLYSQGYSTSVYGGSAYFNGTTDYLTAPDSTQTDLGSGNFTVECWFYQFSSKVTSCISMYTATGTGYAMGASSTANKTWWYANSASQILSSATFNYNAWNHLAVARSGGTTTMYLNGVSVGSFSDSINYVGTTTYIGVDEFSQYWNGYISDARIVKGTAVYTSNFTPPTSPLTAITNTSLLCNMQNAGIYDNAMQNDILTVSTTYPSITTANKQYGTGSIYSQATGNYLYFPKSNTFYMGSGDFTIEFWIYCNSNSGAIIDQFPNASGSYLTGQYNIILLTTNKLMFTVAASASSTASFTTTGSFATNTWTHVALVRSSGVLKFYINGTADATTLTSSLVVGMTQVAGYMMNAANGQTNPMVGYLDDVRMTPGFARYTSNFTRPSAAFPNYGR